MTDTSTNSAPTYDRYGRMNYHPDYHPNQGKPWTTSEQAYLIDNYEKLGPVEVSLGLGRTVHTVHARACQLRKQGVMQKPAKRPWRRRREING